MSGSPLLSPPLQPTSSFSSFSASSTNTVPLLIYTINKNIGFFGETYTQTSPLIPTFCPPSPAPCWRFPPETRSENGNPTLRRPPAKAETSFSSPSSHTAWQCQRGGWGEGTAHRTNNALIGGIVVKEGFALWICLLFIGLAQFQGFPGDSPKQRGKWVKMLLLSWRGIRQGRINHPHRFAVML